MPESRPGSERGSGPGPGTVTDAVDPGGRPALRLDRGGDSVLIAHTGAQVLSWQRDGRDVLYTASRPEFLPGQPVRGGIPVVFPWFGDHPTDADKPAHGFVRRLEWNVSERGPDASVTLTCTDDASTREQWPFAFGLALTIGLDDALHLRWTIENRGSDEMPCEQALHSYYAVGDIETATVDGLQGVDCTETAKAPEADWDRGAPLRFRAETDRIFQGAPPRIDIDAPALRRRLTLTTTNANSAIVWNPWPAKTARLSQMAADDWRHFVCVESANVGRHALRIAPGASHTFGLRLECASR